jgi:PST family polysaccharide transporter
MTAPLPPSVDPTLEARAARGGRWLIVGRAARAPVELASLMVLARLLEPADFGKVAMVTSVTAFAAMFRDLGLTTVTIQRPTLDAKEQDVLFWSNFGVGALLTAIVAASAPAVAWFFEEPVLLPLTLVSSLQFVSSALGAQHLALLRRELRLGAVAGLQLLGAVAGLGIAVAAALAGLGPWALALSMLASAVVVSLAAWVTQSWRPGFSFDRGRARALLKMGADLTGFHFANYFSRNLDDVIVGKSAGPAALGYYQKAYELLMLPLREVNAPAGTVAIPLLSRLADAPDRYRSAYGRVLQRVLTVTTPLGALLLGVPDGVLHVFLGPDWGPAAPIVSAFGLLLFTQPIGNSTGWLFISQGRTREMFRWGLMGSALSVASFVAGIPWGPVGIAVAYAVSGVLVRLPTVGWYVTRSGPVRARDLAGFAAPFVPAAVAATLALRGLTQVVTAPLAGVAIAIPTALVATALGLAITRGGRRVLAETAEVARGALSSGRGAST